VAALGHLVSQSDKKLAQLKSSYESQLLAERLEIESQLNKISGELSKQNHRAKFLELRAPEAGFVKDLATHTVGAVVSPGTVMLNLVPLNDPLLAEVFLKNEDVGFTRTGQPVRLKLAAYPFQKYGLLEGRVQNISADASVPMDGQRSPNAASLNPATYRVLVTLDTQQLVSPSGEAMKLSPGMQLAAEVHQGRRSVLEYLISPVQKVRQEAGRDR
jgi:hemolysin D